MESLRTHCRGLGTYRVTGSSTDPIYPSRMAAPIKVEVIDLATTSTSARARCIAVLIDFERHPSIFSTRDPRPVHREIIVQVPSVFRETRIRGGQRSIRGRQRRHCLPRAIVRVGNNRSM